MLKIQKNISLSKYTSFKIGGAARWFCAVENNNEIKEALEFAEKNKLKVFVLGGGNNLLISDKGFDGLVVRILDSKFKILDSRIICSSGLSLSKLVSESVKAGLTNLEWAAGIPGTVGGAIVNNAGANSKCMADIVEEVETLDIGNLMLENPPSPLFQRGNKTFPPLKKGVREILKLNNKQCQFSYRNSIFKKKKNILF